MGSHGRALDVTYGFTIKWTLRKLTPSCTVYLLSSPVNIFWSQWLDFFMATMSKTIPTKLIKPLNNIPHLSSDLCLVHKKHHLFKQAKRLNSDRAWFKYIKTRHHLTSALQAAKAQYLKNLSTTIHSPSDFWVSCHKLSPNISKNHLDLRCFNPQDLSWQPFSVA